jgi:hypothetical protein
LQTSELASVTKFSEKRFSILRLTPEPGPLAHYARALGLSEADAIQALAHGISWQLGVMDRWKGGFLILKQRHLVLLYDSDPGMEHSLAAQSQYLDHSCADLLYVSPYRVVEFCQSLASRLVDHLGPEELRRAAFTAIPQGGTLVLDRLAPLLGLRNEQRGLPADPSQPLVVVDDCAISGLRFRQVLAGYASRQIIFVHLYSHPDLRAAIEAREPRVVACVSAEDLREQSSPVPPEHVRRRQKRIEHGECYWIGTTEALCFPWNEPDRTFWNPVTARQERAWKIVPPELCSKNRPPSGTVPLPLQLQPQGQGPLRPSDRVIFGELEGGIVLGDMDSGRGFSLEGIAADLWRALLVHGNPEGVVSALRAEYDVPIEVLREDARLFFKDLEIRGLVEWT